MITKKSIGPLKYSSVVILEFFLLRFFCKFTYKLETPWNLYWDSFSDSYFEFDQFTSTTEIKSHTQIPYMHVLNQLINLISIRDKIYYFPNVQLRSDRKFILVSKMQKKNRSKILWKYIFFMAYISFHLHISYQIGITNKKSHTLTQKYSNTNFKITITLRDEG